MLNEKNIRLVVAMDVNGLIGKGDTLPWPKLSEDIRWFKEHTLHQSVVYGRKTWDSLPEKFRPLPNRENIVLSRRSNFTAQGALVTNSFEEAMELATKDNICIIGGAEIYKLALPIADELIITHIGLPFSGDVYFPTYDKTGWRCKKEHWEIPLVTCATEAGFVVPICFAVYERIAAP